MRASHAAAGPARDEERGQPGLRYRGRIEVHDLDRGEVANLSTGGGRALGARCTTTGEGARWARVPPNRRRRRDAWKHGEIDGWARYAGRQHLDDKATPDAESFHRTEGSPWPHVDHPARMGRILQYQPSRPGLAHGRPSIVVSQQAATLQCRERSTSQDLTGLRLSRRWVRFAPARAEAGTDLPPCRKLANPEPATGCRRRCEHDVQVRVKVQTALPNGQLGEATAAGRQKRPPPGP